MPSFAKIASFAAVAFAALVSAAPIVIPTVADVKVKVPALPVDVNALAVIARDTKVVSVYSVLTELKINLEPVVVQLNWLTAENVTVTEVTQITGQITTTIGDAVSSLKLLVGQPIEMILAGVQPTVRITLTDLVTLLAGILTLVFNAVGHVLVVVKVDLVPVVIGIVASLGCIICDLLQIVLALVGNVLGDVVGALAAVVGDLIPVLSQLGLGSILVILRL